MSEPNQRIDPAAQCAQRLDKWLWHARILKTRTTAAKLASSGKLRLNKSRVTKASQLVVPDDILTFTLSGKLRILRVIALAERRGPYTEARLLYEDLTPQDDTEQPSKDKHDRPGSRLPGSGRPTKKQRRQLDAWLDSST